MEDTSYSDKKVHIGNKAVEFDHKVHHVLEIKDEGLVIIDLLIREISDSNFGRNIVALNPDGSIRWRIEEGYARKTKRPYQSIRYEDGQLIAKCLDSYIYEVDMETGGVEQIRRYDK